MYQLNYLVVCLSLWSTQALVIHEARDSMACNIEIGQDWGGPLSYYGDFYTGDTYGFSDGSWVGVSTIRMTLPDYNNGRTAARDFYVGDTGAGCSGALQTIQIDGSQHDFTDPVNDNVHCVTCYIVNGNGH